MRFRFTPPKLIKLNDNSMKVRERWREESHENKTKVTVYLYDHISLILSVINVFMLFLRQGGLSWEALFSLPHGSLYEFLYEFYVHLYFVIFLLLFWSFCRRRKLLSLCRSPKTQFSRNIFYFL